MAGPLQCCEEACDEWLFLERSRVSPSLVDVGYETVQPCVCLTGVMYHDGEKEADRFREEGLA